MILMRVLVFFACEAELGQSRTKLVQQFRVRFMVVLGEYSLKSWQ